MICKPISTELSTGQTALHTLLFREPLIRDVRGAWRRNVRGVWPWDGYCTIKSVLLVRLAVAKYSSLLQQTSQAITLTSTMTTNVFENVPVFGKLLGKVFAPGAEGEKKKEDGSESPSFPDYMLDPDAVVSLVLSSHLLLSPSVD